MLHYLFAASTDATIDIVYVKTDGEDIGTCGWEDIPSLSIYSACIHKADVQSISIFAAPYGAEVNTITHDAGKALIVTGGRGRSEESFYN